jgi:hypothetical protein
VTGDQPPVSEKRLQAKPEACCAMARDRPNLNSMFSSASIAVIGVGEKPGSVGRAITEKITSSDSYTAM